MKKLILFTAMAILAISSCASHPADMTPEVYDIAANEVQVSGHLIDVRLVKKGQKVFPQNDTYEFTDKAVEAIGGKIDCALSLMEYVGPTKVRCGKLEKILIANQWEDMAFPGWEYTGKHFELGHIKYYIHEYTKAKVGEWVDIPIKVDQVFTTIVFGHKITVVDTPVYGTVISKVKTLRKGTISNVCITVMPDGNYLASCTGSEVKKTTAMFISRDKGLTWEPHGNFDVAVNKVANYYNLFVHRGALYIMGVGPGDASNADGVNKSNIYICRSDDNGLTWTVPVDNKTGLLFEGLFHTANVPVTVCNGRIWRACETHGDLKKPFMLSAPEDSDLLDASNWTMSNKIENVSFTVNGSRISSLIEGNAVSTPDGKVYNIIRSSSSVTSKYATKIRVIDENTIEYDPAKDVVLMPGGGKKFTIRYDAQSKLYWTITNPDFEENVYHNGIYWEGLSHSLMRNRMVLLYSTDLVNWVEAKDIIYNQDPFFHGFQYTDWTFDGEDIIAVVRTACPEKRGLPVRQHDANMIIFVKIKNFRSIQ